MNILDYTGTKFIERATSLPSLTGDSGEKGKTDIIAQVYIGGQYFEVPVDPVTGKFTWTATDAMPDGDYSVSISIKDRAGNVGKPTLRTMRVDTTPPEAPVLISMYDDVGADKRGFLPGETTDDKRPTLTGVAQKGTTVYLKDAEGNTIGSAVADAKTGIWKIEPTVDLKDGTNSLVLVAEETFDNVTRAGAPNTFDIIVAADGGVLPPNTITITEAVDDAGSATGTLSHGALTDDTTPTLSGSVSAGSNVIVYYRLAGSNTWAGSATATVTGESWSWTPGSALPTGNYEFQASIGANSSALFSLEIATAEHIGLRTRIESAYDDFGQDQGPLANGAITDDATPSLRGRGEANGNVIIRYMLEGGSAASVVVNADSAGNWRWTPAAELQTGVWTFDVQAQGRSSWSNAFKLEITGSGENSYAPTILYAVDDFGTSTGERKSGSSIDDTTPTLHGKAAANSVVYLQAINGAEVETFSVIADASSNWQWTPPAELAAGDWKFQVSKGAGEGFGDAFELKIETGGNYSTTIDFEENIGNVDLDSMLYGVNYKTSNSTNFQIYSQYKLNQKISFITPGEFAPEMGGKAVELKQADLVFIQKDYSGSDPVRPSIGHNFSFQLYNPSQNDVLMYLSISRRTETSNLNSMYKTLTVKPGLNTFTNKNLFSDSEYPDLYAASEFSLINSADGTSTGNNTPIWFDNLKLEPAYWENASFLYENNDINIHQISGTEELTDTIIIGNVTQIETLQLTGKDQQLDLTVLSSKIESIEIFDITGSGDNTLKLDLNALLQHGEKDLFIEDGKTQLMVKGNEGDVIQLKDILPEGSDISEWQHQDGTITVAGVEYNVYSHGDDAELLVQQGLKTELV